MNLATLVPLFDALGLFARSGGGGSSSGGGSGGGIGYFIFLVGYAVGYGIASLFRKLLGREAAFVPTIIMCSILSVILIGIGFAGGDLMLGVVMGSIAVGVWVGWSTVMFGFWDKMKGKLKKADTDLAQAGWNEVELQQVANQTFMRYQYDWSRRDASHFFEYMTPYYANHATLMIYALTELHRFDVLNNVQILHIDTSAVIDNTDNSQDYFSVFIEAKANDVLMDETQKTLYTDNNSFIEEWTFQRGNGTWLLANIRQTTEAQSTLEADMRQFATENGMYYSLDMGWLFIPARGELFNNGQWSFGYSDINNHVIGMYNNRLVQLYTYVRSEDKNDQFYALVGAGTSAAQSGKTFLVGQISVPKEYGGILVERKTGLFHRMFAPKGYQKYDLEWPDFNNRYSVYATDQSRLATFELLNPGFMAFLYDNFNDISIEVVDNIIYFYAPKTGQRSDYTNLMQLLMKAFKELQL